MNFIKYLESEIQRYNKYIIELQNCLDKISNVKYKEGDVVFCLSKKKPAIFKGFDRNNATNKIEAVCLFAGSIHSADVNDYMEIEDLVPYTHEIYLLYGK